MGDRDKVEITLNTDMDISSPGLSEETLTRISETTHLAQLEQQALQRNNVNPEMVQSCYNLLYERMQSKQGVTAEELLNTVSISKLPNLIAKINLLIKERGDLWQLRKGKSKGKTTYFLELRV